MIFYHVGVHFCVCCSMNSLHSVIYALKVKFILITTTFTIPFSSPFYSPLILVVKSLLTLRPLSFLTQSRLWVDIFTLQTRKLLGPECPVPLFLHLITYYLKPKQEEFGNPSLLGIVSMGKKPQQK